MIGCQELINADLLFVFFGHKSIWKWSYTLVKMLNKTFLKTKNKKNYLNLKPQTTLNTKLNQNVFKKGW